MSKNGVGKKQRKNQNCKGRAVEQEQAIKRIGTCEVIGQERGFKKGMWDEERKYSRKDRM